MGSSEDDIVRYKTKCNEWQPTCSFNSSWILLRIAALRIAAGDSNGLAICSKSVWCCLFVYRDTSWWTAADISCLLDIKRTFFDRKNVCWCLSQDIAGIFHESHANHHVIINSEHDYSQLSDGQTSDFALFKLIKATNLDINAAGCLHVVHILQHPTSRPTTRSTEDTMVNAPKRTFPHFQRGNTAHQWSIPHDNVIKQIKVIVASRQKGSER